MRTSSSKVAASVLAKSRSRTPDVQSGLILGRVAVSRRTSSAYLASLPPWSGLDASGFIRSSHPAAAPAALTGITTELRSDRLLPEESQSALEEILRTAYSQLAARDARDARLVAGRQGK